MMRYFFFIIFFCFSFSIYSQEIKILGSNDIPVVNASVVLKNDLNQRFNLFADNLGVFIIPDGIDVSKELIVSISHIGYKPYVDTFYFKNNYIIYLQEADILLEQIVVTAQIYPRMLDDAVHKINVINRSSIDLNAATTLQNVLEKEVNMRVSNDNILGGSFSMQGISGENVKILIDGVPVIGRLNGNVDISQINLNNIDRIEIVEGPLSVNYGTDALAGTVNLISDQSHEQKMMVNTYYESVGKYNMDALYRFSFLDNVFSFSLARNYFDGWSANDEFNLFPKVTLADTNRVKTWNPKEQLFLRSQHSFDYKNIVFRSFADLFFEEIQNRGFPRSPYYESAFDDYYRTWRKNIGLDVSSSFNHLGSVKALFAYNDYKRIKNTYLKDLTNLNEVLTQSISDQDTSLFNSVMSRASWTNKIENIDFEIGYDIHYDKAKGQRIESNVKSQGDYAFYTNIEWSPLNNLIIRPGFRIAYNTDYKAPITPSLHLKYNLDDWILRASFAQGFRSPSLKELYFEFVDINHNIVGNTDLQAESSMNYNMNLSWKRAYSNHLIRIDLSPFYNNISQLITLAENESIYTYVNIGDYRTLGSKFNIFFGKHDLQCNIGSSYIGRYNKLSETESINAYDFSLEYNSNISYNISKIDLDVSLFYKYTGKLPSYVLDNEGNVQNSVIDDYNLLDFSFSKYIFAKKVNIMIGCKNIFNVMDIAANIDGSSSHSSSSNSIDVGYGRSFFTAIKWNL